MGGGEAEGAPLAAVVVVILHTQKHPLVSRSDREAVRWLRATGSH